MLSYIYTLIKNHESVDIEIVEVISQENLTEILMYNLYECKKKDTR